MRRLFKLCDKLGVHHKPAYEDGVWIVPIHSWYHSSWDTEPDLPGASDITKVLPADPGAAACSEYMRAAMRLIVHKQQSLTWPTPNPQVCSIQHELLPCECVRACA